MTRFKGIDNSIKSVLYYMITLTSPLFFYLKFFFFNLLNMPPFTKISDGIPLPDKEKDNPDYRGPLYVGEWKKSIPYVDEDIAIDDLDEIHMKRKLSILNKYPEIEKIYGYDTSTI